MIRFACPGCSATFTVGDEKAGKTGKCPKCQTQFLIPAVPDPEAPPPLPETERRAEAPPPLPPAASGPPPLPPPPPPALESGGQRPPNPLDPVEIQPCLKCSARLSVLPGDLGLDVECPNCQAVYKAVRADAPPPPSYASGRSRPGGSLVKLGSGGDNTDDTGDRRSKRHSRRDDGDDRDHEDRPSRRGSRRNEDDADDRPSKRRSRYADGDDPDRDYRPRPSRRRGRGRAEKPSQVQTIGVLMLVGGILATITGLGMGVFSYGICCLWPGTYYELVYGIMAIIKGSQLMGRNDPPDPPKGILVMAIITIINGDVLNLVFGIVGLSLLNNPEVQDYYDRRG